MRTAFEIRMDYRRALNQAEELERVARDLRRTATNDLQDCISDISHNWTGENSSAYIKKCNTLKTNIEKTARKIEKTAGTIRTVAQTTYHAEMAALNLLRS